LPKDRGLKTRKPFSNSLRNDLDEKFRKLHETTDVPMSKLLDQAIELLLKKHGKG
jgi:hypothetical protein